MSGGDPAPDSGALRAAALWKSLVSDFLSEEEERAWHGLLETHGALVSAVDARLLAEHNVSLSTFEALMQIAHAEEDTISVSELAERIRLSPSQVSRLAIDLERKGHVKRQRSSTDSRSTRAAVTEAGLTQLREAVPTYLSTIRALLFDPLSERDVKQLGRIWELLKAKRAEDRPSAATNETES